MHVALAAVAATRHQQALAVFGQVADDLVGGHVDHFGADRHADGDVFAGLAEHLPALAVFAALRAELALVAEVDEGVEVFVGLHPDAAAVAAIAAIGAAEGDELLATEADAAIAAATGKD